MGSMGGLSLLSGGGAGSTGDKLTGGSKAANKANKQNLAYIKSLFLGGGAGGGPFGGGGFGEGPGLGIIGYGDQKYGEALKAVEGVGTASKNDALSQEKQYIASNMQGLQSLGLSGSTAAMNSQRGIHSDTLRTLGGINESIAQMRAGLLTGQAGFQQGNAFNLAGILGGVQHQPGTNYLAELMKMGTGALMMCDRRLKHLISRVDILAGADGIPFGLYRFTYRKDPQQVVFEGVMAQEVRHLPGVVFERQGGVLMIDPVELERQTGVRVRAISNGVVI